MWLSKFLLLIPLLCPGSVTGAIRTLPYPAVIPIPESSATTGEDVWTFMAIDTDDGDFDTCTLTGTDAGHFVSTAVASEGCKITFGDDFDFDSGQSTFRFGLNIGIAGTTTVDVTDVFVTLSDEDDVAPCFSVTTITVDVKEGLPPGEAVVLNTDTDVQYTDSDTPIRQLEFSISTGSDDFFLPNKFSPTVRTRRAFDYEVVADRTHSVDLVINDPPNNVDACNTMAVTMNVLNVNDNPIYCTPHVLQLTAVDRKVAGNIGTAIGCSDQDEDTFTPSCSLAGHDTTLFAVTATTSGSADSTGGCQLTNIRAIDITETYNGYFYFDLLATDTDFFGVVNTATVQVSVKVSKASTGTVVLNDATWPTAVPEDAYIGTRLDIANLMGFADPSDEEYTHLWEITAGAQGDWDIDPQVGYIYMNKGLDYEQFASYSMTISVTRESGVATEPSAVATLTVNVVNVDDEFPTFTTGTVAFHDMARGTDYSPTLPKRLTIAEDSAARVLTTFAVNDIDSPNLGVWIESLFPNEENTPFSVSLATGGPGAATWNFNLLRDADLDSNNAARLEHDYYHAVIVVNDGFHERRNYIDVTITPDNDQTPAITAHPQVRDTSEGAVPGQLLSQVIATDADTIESQYDFSARSVRFAVKSASSSTLTGVDGTYFAIDRFSGQLYLKQAIDTDGFASPPHAVEVVVGATDEYGDGNPATDITITLNFYDENDNPPECSGIARETMVELIESQAATFTILDFSGCTDLDFGETQGFAFELYQTGDRGDGTDIFSVTAAGVLQLDGAVDFDFGQRVFELVVRVYETDNGPKQSHDQFYTVTVLVTPDQDSAPVFDTAAYTATVSDAIGFGALVPMSPPRFSYHDDDGTLFQDPGNPHAYDKLVVASCTCTPVAASCPFALEAEAELLYVIASVEDHTSCVITLDALDKAGGTSATPATVTITIDEDSGQAPTCDPASHKLIIPETTAASAVLIADMQCADEDGDALTFTLSEPSDPFFNAGDGSGTGQFLASADAAFDFSVQKFYDIGFVATDVNGNSVTVPILIVIQSVNDVGSITCTAFLIDPLPVSEATMINTELGRLSCADDDGAEFTDGQLHFSLTGGGGKIGVDPFSGLIYLAEAINYETVTANPVTVDFVVTDNSGDSTTIQREFQFTNVNDLAPTCTQAFDATNAPAGIAEDGLASGSVIATLTCDDGDAEATFTQDVSLQLVGGTDKSLFSLSATSCSLTGSTCTVDIELAKELDIDDENARFSVIEVQITDTYHVNRYTLQLVTTPVNEFPPAFDNLPGSVDFYENTPLGGDSFFTVVAHDDDSSDTADGQFLFSLDAANAYFDIDPTSGDVFQIGEVDYEVTGDEVLLDVVVTDLTGGLTYPTATLTVSILNLNDEAPTWNVGNTWSFDVAEDTVSTALTTLLADEADGVAADLRFSIVSQEPATPTYYTINELSGVITKNAVALDYETSPTVILEVKVCDNQGRPGCLYDTEVIYICVTNVDEFDPVFIYTEQEFAVREDDLPGYQVGAVELRNQETGQDAVANDAKCTIQSAAVGGYFAVDSNTCVITLIAAIDRETVASETLIVKATDVTDATKTATTTVSIFVMDVNDNSPDCGGPNYESSGFNIDEESSGTLVEDSSGTDICITCTDDDTSPYFGLESHKYKIASINGEPAGDTGFALDYSQAACQFGIKMNRDLSYEDGVSQFLVEVTATDYKSVQDQRLALTSTIYIPIVLNDVNEDDPEFSMPENGNSDTITIDEFTARGTIVYTFAASQAEDTLIPPTFRISTSPQIKGVDSAGAQTNQPNAFKIATETGELMVNADLDYAVHRRYIMEVIAVDTQGTFGTVPTATLTISIADVNNHTPVFSSPSYYTFDTAENSAIGTVVGTVTATDDDEPPNSDLSFYIVSGNQGNMFNLTENGNAGERDVVLQQIPLDYETYSQFTLVIHAIDDATRGFKLTGSTTFNIEVLPENEHTPQWAAGTDATAQVDENTAVGTVVATVAATDDDSGDHGWVVYTISSQIDYPGASTVQLFAIDTYSGEVTVNQEIDRETTESVNLVIDACDNVGVAPKNCISSNMLIEIGDVEDNPPSCTISMVGVDIVENAPVNKCIRELADHCSDADATEAFNTLSYAFSAAMAPFDVGADSGKVYLSAATLDYETSTSYSGSILVSDGSGTDATVSIAVTVLPVNEFTPAPTGGGTPVTPASPVEVTEDTAVNSAIAQINYSDDDDGLDGEILCTLYNGTEFFRIDPLTCEIQLVKELDFETSPECYEVLVIIYDRSPNPDFVREAQELIEICKVDVNDNKPICDPMHYYAYIDDDIPANGLVVTVSCSDADSTLDDNNGLFYEITSETPAPAWGNFQAYVFGTTTNGPDVTVDAIVDLETDPVDYFELELRVADQLNVGANVLEVTSSVLISVTVRDINNYEPVITFPADGATTQFNETDCCDSITLIDTLVITDQDYTHVTLNQNFTGEIVSGNTDNTFRLLPGANWNELELHIQKNLDREYLDNYELEIEVYDEPDYKGTQRTATLTWTIEVTDVDDNPPICEVNELTFTIYEGYDFNNTRLGPSGPTGLQLPCTDADSSSVLVASLTGGIPSNVSDHFEFIRGPGANTLELNITDQLYYRVNENHTYTLFGEVTDSNNAVQEFTIYVVTKDNNTGNGALSCSDVNIGEESPISTMVVDVYSAFFTPAADPEYPYDSYTFSFSGGNAGGYFDIDAHSGAIRVRRTLDREATNRVSVSVSVSDGSSSVSCTFRIFLDEYNDNCPLFNPQSYHASIAESAPIGTTVLRLTVTDEDDNSISPGKVRRQEVALTAISGDAGHFQVENCSPNVLNQFCLVTTADLDVDLIQFYRFQVQATDNNGGTATYGPQLSGFGLVTIKVVEANEHSPVVATTGGTTFSFPEDWTVGSRLSGITLSATDADSNLTWLGNVRYSLDYSGDANPTLAAKTVVIDQYNGSLYLTCPFDHETQASFDLVMVATDNFDSGNSDTMAFTINVEDVNDEPPVFSRHTYSGTIDDASTAGSTVSMANPILATDADTDFDTIQYSIDYGSCNVAARCDDFAIDASSAVLSVASGITLDYDAGKMTYVLPILAVDNGAAGSELTASAFVYVQVADVNDNVPVLSPNPTEISIYEEEPINTVIAQLSASDADSTAINSGFTFTQLNYNTLFSTNSATGRVTLIRQLNRESAVALEKREFYDVEIRVSDQATNPAPLTFDSVLRVEVMDINDNDPIFSQATYTTTISECLPPYSNILNVSATDADFGINSDLNYSFVSDSVEFFLLQPEVGWLYSTEVLDRETYPSGFVHRIVAWDQGIPPRSGTSQIQILIEDCNDETPVFDKEIYTWRVSEAASINTRVNNGDPLLATDDDEALTVNSEIRYSISSTDFEIWTDVNGFVRTAAFLDRETTASYTLDCFATDQGTPQLTGTATCIILVTDVNDEIPTYTSNSFTYSINENLPAGYVLATLLAIDNDEDGNVNSEIEYTMNKVSLDGPTASSLFSYGEDNGVLSIRRLVDYEAVQEVVFEVFAVDKGTPPLTGSATVTISIIDLNDNRPVFEPDNFYHSIITQDFESYQRCAASVFASDEDSGANGFVNYYFRDLEYKFEITPITGCVILRQDQRLRPGDKYGLRVIARDNGSPNLAADGLIRIDVIDPKLYAVSMTVQRSYSTFPDHQDNFEAALTNVCQFSYPGCRIGTMNLQRNANTNRERKRRTASVNEDQSITTLIYGLRDDSTGSLENLENDIVLLTKSELLELFQENERGDPVDALLTDSFDDFPITNVEGYPDKKEKFTQSAAGIVIIIVTIITILLVLTVLALYVYLKFKNGKDAYGYTFRSPAREANRDSRRGPPPRVTERRPNQTITQRRTPAQQAQFNQATQNLQSKSIAPVVAAAPPQKINNAPPPTQQPQNQPTQKKPPPAAPKPVQVKPVKDVKASDLAEFDGMAQDPSTGRFYGYNKQSGKRKWFTSKEVEAWKAKRT